MTRRGEVEGSPLEEAADVSGLPQPRRLQKNEGHAVMELRTLGIPRTQ